MAEGISLTPTHFGAREEEVKFHLDLDKALMEKHRDLLECFPVKDVVLQNDDDVLKLTYTLHINYFGKVAQCLTAIETLADTPGVVRAANVEELKHGRILIHDVLKKLDNIIAKQ